MTIDRSIFIRAFKDYGRENNFSHWALNELFDYFEQLESDMGEEIEFDCIAICCDYNEMSFDEIRKEYSNYKEMTDDEIIDELNSETTVVAFSSDSIIFQAY